MVINTRIQIRSISSVILVIIMIIISALEGAP
jgi:hypothetical protein